MAQKIKVLQCIRQGKIGGGESHMLSLTENLDRNRFEPLVLSFTDGPMMESLRRQGVPTRLIHTETPFDIRVWKQVKSLLRTEGVQLVHAHGTRAASNVLPSARALGIPLIYTVHGWSFHQDQKPLVRTLRTLGERYLVSRSSLNISVSQSNQQSGAAVLPGFHSEVINNGIDRNRFNPDTVQTGVRKELGIPEDAVLVLFIARFTGQKQPLSLLQAFAAAAAENQKLYLLMVGEGDERPQAEAFVRSSPVADRILLSPFRQDVPQVLAAADIFVLPSLWEGLPIGLLEAMAMGKAVIATQVDGTSEVVLPEVNGIMVPTEGLVPHLTTALLRMAGSAELRRQFSAAARKTVAEGFDAASMTRRIEDCYQRVLKA